MSKPDNITTFPGAGTELPLELDNAAVEMLGESLRGQYDVTRMQQRQPQLVNLIAWLISLPGMTYDAIAKACGPGVCWETVAAIAATRKTAIREFKLRMADKLGAVLEAALPGMLQRAAEGKLNPLEFKLLTESWLQLSGEGHTVKFEGAPQEDPRRQRLKALLDHQSPMVFEAEVIPHLAGAAPVSSGLTLPDPS